MTEWLGSSTLMSCPGVAAFDGADDVRLEGARAEGSLWRWARVTVWR